jgi:hypothetical protein
MSGLPIALPEWLLARLRGQGASGGVLPEVIGAARSDADI